MRRMKMNKEIEILDCVNFRCEIAQRLDLNFEQDIFDLQDEASNIIDESCEALEFCEDKFIFLNKLNTNNLEGIKSIECYYTQMRNKDDLDEYVYVVFDAYEDAKKYYDDIIKSKTMEDWNNSKENYFESFFKPGDIVDQDVVEYFVNSLPPVTLREYFVQAGEPYNHRVDPEDKICKATYPTFERGIENWIYKGNCFKDKDYDMTYATEVIEETEDLEQ